MSSPSRSARHGGKDARLEHIASQSAQLNQLDPQFAPEHCSPVLPEGLDGVPNVALVFVDDDDHSLVAEHCWLWLPQSDGRCRHIPDGDGWGASRLDADLKLRRHPRAPVRGERTRQDGYIRAYRHFADVLGKQSASRVVLPLPEQLRIAACHHHQPCWRVRCRPVAAVAFVQHPRRSPRGARALDAALTDHASHRGRRSHATQQVPRPCSASAPAGRGLDRASQRGARMIGRQGRRSDARSRRLAGAAGPSRQ